MKESFPFLPAGLAALLAAAACFVSMAAQVPQTRAATATPQPGSFPAPTNLKVLPHDLTGQQVHDIMEQWKAGLGMGCAACHAKDKEKIDRDGRPLLDFASDAKPEKATARLMYAMTGEINQKYIAKIDSSWAPVTCGTCHRGHMDPEPFAGSPNLEPRAQTGPPPSNDGPPPE